MADNTKLILFGAAGVAIWYYFFYTPAATAPAAAAAPSAGAAPPVTPPAAAAPSTIDALYQSVLSASGNPSAGLGVDQWGFYLNNALAAAGKPAAPDPMPLFPAGFDRSSLIPIAQYWAVMAPALRTQLGLSGLGNYGMAAVLSSRRGR